MPTSLPSRDRLRRSRKSGWSSRYRAARFSSIRVSGSSAVSRSSFSVITLSPKAPKSPWSRFIGSKASRSVSSAWISSGSPPAAPATVSAAVGAHPSVPPYGSSAGGRVYSVSAGWLARSWRSWVLLWKRPKTSPLATLAATFSASVRTGGRPSNFAPASMTAVNGEATAPNTSPMKSNSPIRTPTAPMRATRGGAPFTGGARDGSSGARVAPSAGEDGHPGGQTSARPLLESARDEELRPRRG